MYIVFIAILIMFFIITFPIFGKEILSPPILVLLLFILCSVIGLIRWDDWRLYEFSLNAVLYLITGILSFLLAAYFAKLVYPNKLINNRHPLRRNRIEVGVGWVLFLIVLGLITNVLSFVFIKSTVARLGFDIESISRIINHFRNIEEIFPDDYSMPITIKVFYWISICTGSFSLFIFTHNMCFKVLKKKDFWLLVIVGLWISVALLNSHRSYILMALAEVIYFLYFFWDMYVGKKSFVNKKIFKWGVGAFVGIIVCFLVLAILLGRRASFKELDIIDYITMYVSSGVRNFDLYIKEPVENNYFGMETFPSLYRTLANRFGIGMSVDTALEFRYIDGLKISNIYTPFRRYYSDFGIVGLIIIPAFWGFSFTYAYERIKNKCRKNIIDFDIIFFAYGSKVIFHMPIEEVFLNFEISINGIFKIIILFGLYFIFRRRIRQAKVEDTRFALRSCINREPIKLKPE